MSHGYLKMDCEGDKCYGVLAVRPNLSTREPACNGTIGPPHLLRIGPIPLLPRCFFDRREGYEGQAGRHTERVRGYPIQAEVV